MTTDYVLVTTTAGPAKAEELADHLVRRRLAACAHVEKVNSVYWWEGDVQHETEWRVEFKTASHRAAELQAAILDEHSYDNPQVIVTPILDGAPRYLAWLTEETTLRT